MTFDTLGYLVHMSHKIARRTARFFTVFTKTDLEIEGLRF